MQKEFILIDALRQLTSDCQATHGQRKAVCTPLTGFSTCAHQWVFHANPEQSVWWRGMGYGLWPHYSMWFLLMEISKHKIYHANPHIKELEGNIHREVHRMWTRVCLEHVKNVLEPMRIIFSISGNIYDNDQHLKVCGVCNEERRGE
jgi:hypothetical protein